MNTFVRLTTDIATVEYVVLMAVLVFFCFRTRSKGMICIAVSLIGVRGLGWLVPAVYNTIWGERWESGVDVRSVSWVRNLEVAIVASGIAVVLCYGLCLLGAFLIYKEWRDGKFNVPPSGV
ncbi:MAG: hypothetical protein OXN25_01475 [Candidatus Poribacteria bacterium]|nr:hypothetical protein [Candidatus Poribacteria bacterium]